MWSTASSSVNGRAGVCIAVFYDPYFVVVEVFSSKFDKDSSMLTSFSEHPKVCIQ